jgi:hypothetical protein
MSVTVGDGLVQSLVDGAHPTVRPEESRRAHRSRWPGGYCSVSPFS